jgi:hypothetical protein
MTLHPNAQGPRAGGPPLHRDAQSQRVGGPALPEPLGGMAERAPVLLIFLRHFG